MGLDQQSYPGPAGLSPSTSLPEGSEESGGEAEESGDGTEESSGDV